MKSLSNLFFLISMIVLLSCGDNKTIKISFNQESSVLKYGTNLFEKHCQDAGFAVQKSDIQEGSKGIIIISKHDSLSPTLNLFRSDNISDIKDDGFKIIRKNNQIFILGNSDRGCLYGILDVIEQMGNSCDLSKIVEKHINPAFAFRAVKFNLPWSPYRPGPTNDIHIETCKDLKFWESFLDMCIKNRFNAITLWNNHPFPFMIRAKNYPKATPFNDQELAEWQDFHKTLFKMAKER